jgi:carbon-monoxide dehydrogenase small subunit
MTMIELTVDGRPVRADVAPRTLLVLALRDTFKVTGPHVGCESGRCGACTVLLDGDAVKSCMVLAVQADGTDVVTAAGLDAEPVRTEFHEHHALQCGYCTPGMVCAAADLLRHTPNPTEDQVRQGMRGNLCRCTGYQHIVDAVMAAGDRR